MRIPFVAVVKEMAGNTIPVLIEKKHIKIRDTRLGHLSERRARRNLHLIEIGMAEIEIHPYFTFAELHLREVRVLDTARKQQSAKEKAVYQSFHTHPSYQLKVMSPPPGVQSSTTKSKLPR